jgi:hypothetical protein
MSEAHSQASPTFRSEQCFDQNELLGARWWYDSLVVENGVTAAAVAGTTSRRQALATMAVLGTGIVIAPVLLTRSCAAPAPWTPAISVQREQGWATGAPSDRQLVFQGALLSDCDGKPFQIDQAKTLADQLRPLRTALAPWFCPTLMQVLQGTVDERLRQLRPICTPAMRIAHARGKALGELLRGVSAGADLALVVDLPGPESVAFAAALAEVCHVVFTFDNWPHPLGVVPAHETLAALCYYAPMFQRSRGDNLRPALFALDRARLNPYANDSDRFDNRYRVRLPDGASMKTLEIRNIFYVVPEGAEHQELDDLNEYVVGWRARELQVRMLDLGDFRPEKGTPALAPLSPTGPAVPPAAPHYYFGSPLTHWWFWNHMPWYPMPSGVRATDPGVRPSAGTYLPNLRTTPFNSGTARLGVVRDTQRSSGGSSGSWGRTSGSGFSS